MATFSLPHALGRWLRHRAAWLLVPALLLPTLSWGAGFIHVVIDLDFAGNGSGVVSGHQFPQSPPQTCRTDCSVVFTAYPGLPEYYLVAAADPGSRFVGWNNCPSRYGQDGCTPLSTLGPCLDIQYDFCAYGQVTATFQRLPAGDADADRKADLFWREPAGNGLSWWTMNGAAVTGANYLAVGPEWQLLKSCDLTGDGKADLVWRRPADGVLNLWALDGLAVSAYADPGIVDAARWTLAGCADLDRDGKSDLLWREIGGPSLYAWLMDGGAVLSQGALGTAGPEWQVAGVADLDRNGRDDVVWRDAVTGEVYAWFMNGLAIESQKSVATLDPAAWKLASVADFDGNGHADLLWRHVSGDTWVWLLDAGAYASGASVGTPGLEWTIASVADRDGDGKADILWRRTDGALWAWKMNGLAVASQAPLVDPGANWQVAAP